MAKELLKQDWFIGVDGPLTFKNAARLPDIVREAPLERILVETAMAMIDVVRANEMSRLLTCAADDCDGVVLDLSRNRSRRYCSTTCSNRAAQAAHRKRQASGRQAARDCDAPA